MDQRRLFEVIAREAMMSILAFDPESRRCVFINRLARERLEIGMEEESEGQGQGQEHDQTIPLTLDELIFKGEISDRRMARPLSEEMLKSEGFFQDVLLERKNGERVIANVGVRWLNMDDGKQTLLLMFQDVTIQKKLQRDIQAKQEEIRNAYTELLEQNKQLMELDSAKDRFIALTTHELRTPLAAIVATAEVLELKFYDSDEQRDEFIKTIHEQSRHLMELVNDILDFAKIRAGKMEFFVGETDVLPVVRKTLVNFENMAAQVGVSLSIECSETELKAYIDVLRFKEVVENVVNNAIKYNRPGGFVKVSFQADLESLRISVTDSGPGIAESKIEHVFNEFETVGNVARHHKGTGLGMPISKRYMMSIGGNLTLESVEGQGTTFFIDIPRTKVLDESMYGSRGDEWGDLAA